MKKLIIFFALIASAFAQSAGVGTIWTTVSGALQSGATANANGAALNVNGLSSVVFEVNCSVACSGGTTINFEGSASLTPNYVPITAIQIGTGTLATTVVNQGTTVTAWQAPVAGLQLIRARISSYSAGTISVNANATAAPWDSKTINSNAFIGGTAVDGNSGNKSAQTQRVVIATDQPALTNKLLVTPDSVALPANQSVNLSQANGTTLDTNSGNKSAGTPRVVIATDQPNLTSALNVSAAESGTWTVQPGNTANTSPWLAAPAAEATTTNSALTSYLTSAASTNSTSVKGSAGNVYGISAINTTATLYFLRMYNSSSAPTCSSATGYVESIPIPASATGAGVEIWPHVPQGYTTGIGFCLTGGGSSTDNTNAATGVYLRILYK